MVVYQIFKIPIMNFLYRCGPHFIFRCSNLNIYYYSNRTKMEEFWLVRVSKDDGKKIYKWSCHFWKFKVETKNIMFYNNIYFWFFPKQIPFTHFNPKKNNSFYTPKFDKCMIRACIFSIKRSNLCTCTTDPTSLGPVFSLLGARLPFLFFFIIIHPCLFIF